MDRLAVLLYILITLKLVADRMANVALIDSTQSERLSA
jgi:hypothetical protein